MQTVSRFFWKELWGNLSHKMSTNCVSSTQSLTVPMNSAIYIGRVLSQFQTRWRRGWYIAYCRWSSQKEREDLVPHTRGLSVVKIIPLMPATTASSERAFSALRRVKSYLCSTMSNNRLHHLVTCTVHEELVKELNLKQVTNDFVDRVERRSSIFMTWGVGEGTKPQASHQWLCG